MSADDMIKRGDALKTADEELHRYGFYVSDGRRHEMQKAIAALPAVTPKVRPLVWHPENDGIGWRAECPIDPSLFYFAETVEQREEVEKTRATRILAALDLTPAPDTAALVDQARFLAERLREWEADYIHHDEAGTQWIGNVIPPLVRLEAVLALLPKGSA